MIYDCLIIGTGPAGLIAANHLETDNYLILEKNNKPGKKLLTTGGGRCNLTNLKPVKEFLDNIEYNQKYLYSTINRFGPSEIYEYFNPQVPLKEEFDNKVFPVSNNSSDILNFLINNVKDKIKYLQDVKKIIPGDIITVETIESSYQTKNLVIATGGASFKELGSSGDHIKFAKDLNLKVIPLFPAETSILIKEKLALSGTSINEVIVTNGKVYKTGNLMFTEHGLSGTSIMALSEFIYLDKSPIIYLDLLPKYNHEELKKYLLNHKEQQLISVLSTFFTKKLSKYIIDSSNINNELKIKSIPHREIDQLIQIIKDHQFKIDKVNDINKAYVTGGGISLDEVNTITFATKKHPNIYIVGEALDIHGPIGGYNITLAMSTGYSAATAINKNSCL